MITLLSFKPDFQPQKNIKNNSSFFPNLNLKSNNLAPLSFDTVSFTGRRNASNKISAMSASVSKASITSTEAPKVQRSSKKLDPADIGAIGVANDILSEVDFAYGRFRNDISAIFGLPVIDAKYPKRLERCYSLASNSSLNKNAPILMITSRKKTPKSLAEKMGSKKIKTKKAAKEEITDILGIRILISKPGKASGDYVLSKLTEAVKKDWIRIVEIENYRNPELKPSNKYSYVNQSAIDELAAAIRKKGVRNFKNTTQDTESGYTAIHMLVDLPNNIKGELQILGPDVARLKDIEDLCYKPLTEKNLPKKYAKLEKMFKALKADDKKYAEFMEYTRLAYANERKREPHSFDEYPEFLSLPAKFSLSPEYDFNNIAKYKQQKDKS